MTNIDNGRRFSAVPFTRVAIDDAFWTPRITVNRERTLAAELKQCRETGRIGAFALDWTPEKTPKPHYFWDSDVAKWVEAASYSLATHPDPELERELDEVIALIAGAQQPDGYLNIYFTVVEPEKRWANLRDCHELYCAGHLIEAAVAHFQATGKRTLLDPLCRYADYIATVFGRGEGRKPGYCGHEEIELALVKLYRATGERRYLDLAAYFVDERGRQPHYFETEAIARGEKVPWTHPDGYAYSQAHVPVREQDRVVGHAVRAMYLYAAMADLAAETNDDALLAACERLWANLCLSRMYITGGIGPSRHNEGFTADYDLPNLTAYAETCAAIGLVFWNHRLLQLTGDGRYADIMERALYNGVISGVSLDGERFFYENPLASNGGHHRKEWFSCACCPPNIARLLASLGEYVYSESDDAVAVHLYIGGTAMLKIGAGAVRLSQSTEYPWHGAVRLTIEETPEARYTVRLRIPGWARGASVTVNGETVSDRPVRGYLSMDRLWKTGDVIRLNMPQPVERIVAHPAVVADQGRVALQRGPLVYCIEDIDHDTPVSRIVLPDDALLTSRFDADLLEGVVVVEAEALAPRDSSWQDRLYQPLESESCSPVRLRAVPYYAWDNRDPGAMAVWLPRH